MKLVYMGDSKSPVARRVGSSPTAGTTYKKKPDSKESGFFLLKL